jgi:uncharacterized delta-60 repeat protein
MNRSRLSVISAVVLMITVRAFAVDYNVDPTFDPTFAFGDFSVERSIGDVVVQSDGKVVVGGTFTRVNGETSYYIARLNPNGTRDTTFNSPFEPQAVNYVRHIIPLPDGKLLVTGKFYVGTNYTSFVKLNSDGTVDGSLANYAPTGERIVPLADGSFLVCGGRNVNGEPYWLGHRLNGNGTVDPGFRITFSQGTCTDIQLQPDGKILMAGSFHNGNGTYYEPIQRFNSDGSRDSTFNLQTTSAYGAIFSLLPDGKIIASYGIGAGVFTTRFHGDGSRDIDFPNCLAQAYLPLPNGNVLMSGCSKWAGGHVFQFASMRPDGSIEPSLDWIKFQGAATGAQGTVNGFRSTADGKYYAFGNFSTVNGVTRAKIVRLMPYTAPIKPKFDFDGDGISDLAVFRPSDRYWYLYQTSSGPRYVQWGLDTDKPVAANYDTDDRTDIGIYRDYDSVWHLVPSDPFATNWMTFGERGKPMVGDFDGDGKQDWAMRKFQNGSVSWLVSLNSQRGFGFSTGVIAGEQQSDVAVIGDFDGDSREEFGHFRDGVWTTRDFGSGAPSQSFQWGAAGDIPVPEDYDGDGQDDYAVFRPSTGVWWINRSSAGVFVGHFGMNGDIPVPADYDGDGKVDIAIFRNGQWWQYRSNGNVVRVDQWGIAGDIPIPAQAQ